MATTLSKSWVLSIKISLLSLTILTLALLIKVYLPPIMSELLPLLSSWLTRPYLYVVINLIIITIAASSIYQHKPEEEEEEPLKVPVPVGFQQNFGVSAQVYGEEVVVEEVLSTEVEKEMIKDLMVEEAKMIIEQVTVGGGGDGIGVLGATESMEYSVSKPPISARFSSRKIPKGSPEAGKSLKVSKPKRQDTLESTWKMITEGRSMPLARHLKKSDTWETHTHTPKAEQVQKSETFNSRNGVSPVTPNEPPDSESSTSGSGSMKLKKEPSLSQDDLNRRVEAFINKFNEEMRLQRLESLNRYKEMVV